MRNDEMNSDREWIRSVIAHRECEHVPYNFMFSPPALKLLQEHYGADNIEDALRMPIRVAGCKSIKPLYASPAEFGQTVRDEYGVVWSTNEIDRGSPIRPCLSRPDISNYTFPDPSRSYRFEDIGKWCEQNREHYTVIFAGDLWERATFMRGMEGLLVDLATHPGFVAQLLRGIADYVLQTVRILCERFEFDAIAISDDYGTQKAMLISPRDWRRFIKPVLAEIYALAKKHDCHVFHHTCGNVVPIIPDLIEIGLDILHPIQPEAMDIFELKREFGRDLTFCGGLRTQDLLPCASPQEIRAEVGKLQREMGRGGGYILEPGITLQSDIPLDNLLAMIDEAQCAD